jgi:hypothetical protein
MLSSGEFQSYIPNKHTYNRRFCQGFSILCDEQFAIGRGTLAKSQFPDQIIKPDGHVLVRPEKWR